MKLSRTVGLAVAVSLVVATVVALPQIIGAAPAGPTANMADADVSCIRSLVGRAHAAASTKIETIAPSRRAARGQQRSPP